MSLENWHSSRLKRVPRSSSAERGARQLVVDCRGVYDALARSSSSCVDFLVRFDGS